MTEESDTENSKGRRPDIQGLRAVAVLMVVAYHAGFSVPGGFVGVDVFFVISGFVITAMLQREFSSTGTISFSAFYLRRFKRLTPALSLAIFATLAVALLVVSPLGAQTTLAKTAFAAMSLSANIAIPRMSGGYFDTASEHNALLHTWSLSVEEQFYLFFPVLLFLAWRGTRTHRRASIIFLGLVLISGLSMACAILGARGVVFRFSTYILGFYSSVSRTWEFSTGAFLALYFARPPPRAWQRTALDVIGVGALVVSLWAIDSTRPFPGAWTLLPVGGTLTLLANGSGEGVVAKFLSTRALTTIGDYSYSIYLWHWPLIVFADLLWPQNTYAKALAAFASLLPAIASYRFLEQPLRLRSPKGVLQVGALALATLLPPAIMATLVLVLQRNELSATEVVAARDAIDHPRVASERECIKRMAFSPGEIERCSWNQKAKGAPIYLVGDSNAWHFAEAAIEAAGRNDRSLTIVTAPACAPIPGLGVEAKGRSPFFDRMPAADAFAHCPEFVRATFGWLETAAPGLVVLAAHDQYWWDDTLFVSLNGGVLTNENAQKSTLLREGLSAAAGRLSAAGHQVLLVQTIPTFRNPAPLWEPRECTVPALVGGACSRTVSVEELEKIQGPSRRSLDEVAEQVANTTTLDLRERLCPAQMCATHRGSAWLYMDAAHLSFQGSSELAPEFEAAFRRAGSAQ